MKILVTGGAGYIGSHTVVALINAGYTPVIVDNFSNSSFSMIKGIEAITGHKVSFYEGDCRDAEFMGGVFALEEDIQGVIHFAALKAVGESVEKPDLYYDNNVGSLTTLMDVMEKFETPYLVFSSSACVYGEADELPVTEETLLKPPASPYGETKQIGERLIKEAVTQGRPFQAISLRYFNPIGAHPSAHIGELPLGVPNNLVPFVTQTAAGILPELTVFGNDYDTPDGTAIRDYIHVVDLARAHVDALRHLSASSLQLADVGVIEKLAISESPDASCSDSEGFRFSSSEMRHASSYYNVFNLGTSHGNSVLEVIKTFETVNNVKLNYRIGPRRQGDIPVLYANCDKAEKILGWKAELSLADALKDSWKWQMSLRER